MGSANAEVKSRKGITETQRTFNFAKINKKMGSKEQHNSTRERVTIVLRPNPFLVDYT